VKASPPARNECYRQADDVQVSSSSPASALTSTIGRGQYGRTDTRIDRLRRRRAADPRTEVPRYVHIWLTTPQGKAALVTRARATSTRTRQESVAGPWKSASARDFIGLISRSGGHSSNTVSTSAPEGTTCVRPLSGGSFAASGILMRRHSPEQQGRPAEPDLDAVTPDNSGWRDTRLDHVRCWRGVERQHVVSSEQPTDMPLDGGELRSSGEPRHSWPERLRRAARPRGAAGRTALQEARSAERRLGSTPITRRARRSRRRAAGSVAIKSARSAQRAVPGNGKGVENRRVPSARRPPSLAPLSETIGTTRPATAPSAPWGSVRSRGPGRRRIDRDEQIGGPRAAAQRQQPAGLRRGADGGAAFHSGPPSPRPARSNPAARRRNLAWITSSARPGGASASLGPASENRPGRRRARSASARPTARGAGMRAPRTPGERIDAASESAGDGTDRRRAGAHANRHGPRRACGRCGVGRVRCSPP